jgi:hypothetical protein
MRVSDLPFGEIILLALVCVVSIIIGHTVHAIQLHEEQEVIRQFDLRHKAIWQTNP